MNRKQIIILASVINGTVLSMPDKLYANPREPLTSFSFGSCNDQRQPPFRWEYITNSPAQLWLWLGDIVYADNLEPALRQAAFSTVKTNASYEEMAKKIAVSGVWDDHDYAHNGAGAGFKDKLASKVILYNFLGEFLSQEQKQSPGIYRHFVWGPRGKQSIVVQLDTRSFKQDPKHDASLLGEAQWTWLDGLLKQDESQLVIIQSSISVTSPTNIGKTLEGWHQYTKEKKRLTDLILRTNKPTLILSGDRHSADFSRLELSNDQNVVEFMSSGLTHSRFAVPNPFRIGDPYTDTNYGQVSLTWSENDSPTLALGIHSAKSGEEVRKLEVNFDQGALQPIWN